MIISSSRIDIHHHILPPKYLSLLAKVGITTAGNVQFPEWEPKDSLTLMDRLGIETAIVSISSPGIYFGDTLFTCKLAHICNEFTAELIRKYPNRFGGFAVLPLPDVEGSIEELEYALDILQLDGVVLLSNIADIYLGDPKFENLFSELNRRKVVVFIHPNAPPAEKLPNLSFPTSVLEFVFDTTRAITNLIHHGIPKKFPNIRFILAHAGGTVPFLVWRITFGNKRLMKYFENFYYDMAISATNHVFQSLFEIVNPSKLLFGSDFPFVNETIVKEMIQGIENYNKLDDQQRVAIKKENASLLFPRLKKIYNKH
jgi:predicted TIM-barrel fold metal-dependent hydrolase